jgi:hypothetical protein
MFCENGTTVRSEHSKMGRGYSDFLPGQAMGAHVWKGMDSAIV